MKNLEFYFAGFQVVVGDAVVFDEFVEAGDGDVCADFREVFRVAVFSRPDEFQALLAAGGGVWDNYGVVELGGLRVGVGLKPAFYLYCFFHIIFGHYKHVEHC